MRRLLASLDPRPFQSALILVRVLISSFFKLHAYQFNLHTSSSAIYHHVFLTSYVLRDVSLFVEAFGSRVSLLVLFFSSLVFSMRASLFLPCLQV